MDPIINKLKSSGFVPVKSEKNYTVFKSDKGVALSYDDGTIEGFIKDKLNESLISEINIRQKIEMLILIGLGITYFNTDITIVDGRSMEPTLKNHQIIVKTKSSTNVNKILASKNSIVKFKSPSNQTSIKRIVGVPGDLIEFNIQIIKVNGVVVDTKNDSPPPEGSIIQPSFSKNGKLRTRSPVAHLKLKDNEYFVIGDNRNNSIDSREYGPITNSSIISVIEK